MTAPPLYMTPMAPAARITRERVCAAAWGGSRGSVCVRQAPVCRRVCTGRKERGGRGGANRSGKCAWTLPVRLRARSGCANAQGDAGEAARARQGNRALTVHHPTNKRGRGPGEKQQGDGTHEPPPGGASWEVHTRPGGSPVPRNKTKGSKRVGWGTRSAPAMSMQMTAMSIQIMESPPVDRTGGPIDPGTDKTRTGLGKGQPESWKASLLLPPDFGTRGSSMIACLCVCVVGWLHLQTGRPRGLGACRSPHPT